MKDGNHMASGVKIDQSDLALMPELSCSTNSLQRECSSSNSSIQIHAVGSEHERLKLETQQQYWDKLEEAATSLSTSPASPKCAYRSSKVLAPRLFSVIVI